MFLDTAIAAATSTTSNRLGEILRNADYVIISTFILLVFFSVMSWAIIFLKWMQLRAAKAKVARFLHVFWQAKSIDVLLQRGKMIDNPALNVLKASVAPLQERGGDTATRVDREATRTSMEEIDQLELYVPFLATTASVTPFIGLFGTVWGILNAFFEISQAGSSSLQVVGPRIAEALFTTAVGLVAAIPAMIFYNLFLTRIRGVAKDLEQFAVDVSQRVKAEFLDRAA